MDARIALRRATADDLPWINARYDELAFRRSTGEGEVLLVAVAGGAPVGVGRLVECDDDARELGGMFVDPAWRGCGIARALVEALLAASDGRTVYCLPFAHLEALYRAAGFEKVPSGIQPPADIASKWTWCATQYAEPVSMLYRAPRGTSPRS